jgi:hypothetical protein
MRTRYKIGLLIFPLLLWTTWLVTAIVQQALVDRETRSADGLHWRSAGLELESNVEEQRDGELQTFSLSVAAVGGDYRFERELAIDWDVGGGGFLLAMQVDEDPDPEIVYLNRGPQQSLVFDVVGGKVRVADFDSASPHARKIAERWLASYAPNPFGIGLALVATALFYLGVLLVYLLSRLFRWLKKKSVTHWESVGLGVIYCVPGLPASAPPRG